MNSNTTPARRTWSLSIPVRTEGTWLMTITCTVTALRVGNEIVSTFIDGTEASIERVANLLNWARAEGTLELLEAVDAAQPIGKARAHQMHVELARHGYPTNHYDLASGVLGREITSLAALTEAEARTVWTCLIYGARVAA